jgi:hypothetical protein
VYTECFVQNATTTAAHEDLHAQNNETNRIIKFLQPYADVVADALLEIDAAVISSVLSLDDHLSHILPVSCNGVTNG